MNSLGLDESTAKEIEKNYHELYKVNDQWVRTQINKAKKTGYVTLAFGLKLRTPALTVKNKYETFLQSNEIRTAGNALVQSYGLLNNRAMNAVLNRPKLLQHQLDNKLYPIAAIHDACYYMVKQDEEVLTDLFNACIEEAKFNDLEPIYHDKVIPSGTFNIYFPSWNNSTTITNSSEIKLFLDTLTTNQ